MGDRREHGRLPRRERAVPSPGSVRRGDRDLGAVSARPVEDPWYLDRLRGAKIAIVVGQGAWEDEMLADTRALREVLAAKGIPAIVDEWGHDVNHDWPWWRQMLSQYLERLGV